jgi:hypothetical protein
MRIPQEPVARTYSRISPTNNVKLIFQFFYQKFCSSSSSLMLVSPHQPTGTAAQFFDPNRTVYAVILVIDRQSLPAIESDLDKSHISLREPEIVDLLVLTHKVGSVDPKR